ncbi:hypothetical protein PY650_34555 [Rhizobium calliandrae]|uniref:Flp family type IVb pilin n=1 Tax=Rhizobium calliandrae TaxID=1312182 RepID=A0ABT7KQ88_9HYPH|nr:hypothetical protein [Rhizobium calliandrae]MDL2410606.1 hypothetical protein [Rhizobium calliandrae]
MTVETRGKSSIQGDDRVGYELTLFAALSFVIALFSLVSAASEFTVFLGEEVGG